MHLSGPKDELLRHAAAHADINVRRHLLPRPAVLVLLWRLQPRKGGSESWHKAFRNSTHVSKVFSKASCLQGSL